MRDIRRDLVERLASIENEEARLQSQLKNLSTMKEGLKALLQHEDTRFAPPLFSEKREEEEPERTTLTSIIVNALRHKTQMTLEEIKQITENAGYDFGEKKPGRSIHFALVGLQNLGVTEGLGNGVWRLQGLNGHEERTQ
jgi:hypothetical protein